MAGRVFRFLLILVSLSGSLHAASSDTFTPFLGKWKFNASRSRLTDQMIVESAGSNKYNLIFSGDNVETVVADGTDQPGLFGSTIAIVVQDDHSWKIVRKNKGRTTITGLWQLSADGKTLTDNFTGYHDNGSTTNLHYIYQRTAGPDVAGKISGFVGKWESTTADVNSSYEIEVQPFQDGGLSFINSAAQVTQSLEFDGKDYPGAGPNVPQGYASSGHRISDHAVERVDKMNGKTLDTQQIEISSDGKTLTMTVHVPGRDKPNLMVFERE